MRRGVHKTPRRSRVKLPEALQETLLDAVARTGAELLRSQREQSSANRASTRDAAAVQATKRPLDEAFKDPLPAKKARLTETDAQQPRVEDKKAEQAARLPLQQPKPTTPYRGCASFLKEFVDSVPPPEPAHTFVSEWLKSVGSDRDKRCRSDSHLQHSGDDPISRNLARSAPEMGYPRDADGFAVPPMPASTEAPSYRASYPASATPSDVTDSGRSSGRSLVEDPLYRDMNLAANNISMRPPFEEFPQHIADLVDEVRKDRNSPGPSLDQIRQDPNLAAFQWMGAGEPQVEEYFRTNIFPYPDLTESLQRSDRQPMARHAVPSTGSKLKVSNPVPDMLYGYNRHGAFPQQQSQLISMGAEMVANNQGLIYPFFVIEFKGDGPTGGGTMWVATNQCLGGSASCVNIAERLNNQLRKCESDKIRQINSAAFSIAMSGTEARLYISWKHNELDYYMASVDCFLLQKPKDYLEFRKYVRNIMDWGNDKRLKEIRNSLDCLLEESRKRSSEAAKSRQPPSDGSATSSGKKPRSSSSRKNSSRSSSMRGQSRRANGPHWQQGETESQDVYGEPSCYLGWQQSVVDTHNETASQDMDERPAPPKHLYLGQS
ncbi:hypothetical protein MMYC01_206328 [Madurella mycetomatis]|uniref:DUF7924 domain-containing protein n=1 Tax=Madurella mycetomatis TaxID=100816 RepID=A0A175W0L3_9PEZI|nr:hypothetical protein MMYC01_206328 [Madurella mycetomatis]